MLSFVSRYKVKSKQQADIRHAIMFSFLLNKDTSHNLLSQLGYELITLSAVSSTSSLINAFSSAQLLSYSVTQLLRTLPQSLRQETLGKLRGRSFCWFGLGELVFYSTKSDLSDIDQPKCAMIVIIATSYKTSFILEFASLKLAEKPNNRDIRSSN